MSKTQLKSISLPKKTVEHISKFQYYQNHVHSQLFKTASENLNVPSCLKSVKSNRGMTHWDLSGSHEGLPVLDKQTIIESAQRLYLDPNAVKVSNTSFLNSKSIKLPYFPIYGRFDQLIQFVVVESDQTTFDRKMREPLSHSRWHNFLLYVIHHCSPRDNEGMRWQHFTEKYHFEHNNTSPPTLRYNMVYCYESAKGVLSSMSYNDWLNDTFINSYCQTDAEGICQVRRLHGILMQSQQRIETAIKNSNDLAFSESHERWLRLPPQHYKQFTTIRKQAINYFKMINEQNRELNVKFIGNLVCRYMQAKQYNLSLAAEAVIEYLKWQNMMSSTYCLAQFESIHSRDIYTYLGQDNSGRVVILNKAAHVHINEIDLEQYCIYYIYYLQIFLQKKMRGIADQITIIADLMDLSMANFKMAVTKRNIAESLKYSPERQYKLIAINITSFAYYCWMFIQPLLPKHTLSKITIVGTNKNEILDALTKEMSFSVIPEYLGGTNSVTFDQQMKQQKLALDYSEVRSVNIDTL